ncbi:hypothetical protein F5879DRAFT_874404 [Lentinula edodes]|nr:hypothetical protein F5879DRAFT_874404 [Lentinula edodes]
MAALDQQELLRDFPDVTESDLASEFLHAYLTPEARKNISLELCARILLTEPELHEKLKEGHKSQNSEALDNLCAYLRRNAWRFQPRLEEMNELLREIFSDGRITLIAKGEWKGPYWMPPKSSSRNAHIDPETTAYIENLRIPLGYPMKEIPLIILYDLGSFQHNDKLRNRLDRVFSSSKDTFLVNTSGTGKTKLLFEGLCLHWGLYMTCSLDSFNLGAADIPFALDNINENATWTTRLSSTSSDNYASSLKTNIHLVYRAVSEVLLARLLIFKMYLEACSTQGFSVEHRRRWLESQIFPTNIIPYFDPFSMLKSKISEGFLSDEDLDEAITHSWDEIQSFWNSPEMSTAGDSFYIAIDEANVASRKHDEAFEDQHGRYPILKEIIRGLRRQIGSSKLPIRFVVAGTMIPEDHFQSTVGEWDDFRWCSDTGSFNDPEDHRRYVSQFMPDSFSSSVTGQALIARMWYWLRGRHRYTASFLAVLLRHNYQSPHTLLGNYIGNFTEYVPDDNEEYSRGEEPRYNNWYSPLGPTGLLQRSLSMVEMHRAVVTFLTTSEGSVDCSTKDRTLVTEDYGYFTDPDCSHIALDEPLTVTYGAGWLKQNSCFSFAKFIQIFHNNKRDDIQDIQPTPTHFALFLALSFSSILDHYCEPSSAFTVIGLPASLPQVKLVTFTRIAHRLQVVDVCPWSEDAYGKLVLMASTPEETLSWFKHERDEPFCVLPSSSSKQLILVFCLQLADARCFWTFVWISSTSMNKGELDFAQDIKNLHPNEVFRDQPEVVPLLNKLPNLLLDVGTFGVLRVSGSCWAESYLEKSIPQDQYPAGLLNIKGLDDSNSKVSRALLMRRLSHVISQTKNRSAALPAEDNLSKKGKKRRGRSFTIVDDAGIASSSIGEARKTKSVKSSQGDDSASLISAKSQTLRATHVGFAVAGSSTRTGKNSKGTGRPLPSHRGQGRISDVTTRRTTARVAPTDSTAPSSSTPPYNLRKR